MNKNKSINLSSALGGYISSHAPVIEYSDEVVKHFYENLGVETLNELYSCGLIKDDKTLFYVINKFLAESGVLSVADMSYLKKTFDSAKKFNAEWFENNPYIKNVRFPTVKNGNLLITNSCYERGEIFQYDMPDLSAEVVTLSLGFFDKKVFFPTIYEGDMPWMSVCPSEIFSMRQPIKNAFGKVLVLGLGLGYYPYMISEKQDVSNITIIEKNPEIIDLFERYILPSFKNRNKIKILNADAIEYLKSLNACCFDYCFADIWESSVDGAPLYQKIKEQEIRLKQIKFDYWIENQIKAYLQGDN